VLRKRIRIRERSRSQLHDVFVTEDRAEGDSCALRDRPFDLQGIHRVERLGKGFGNVFQSFSKLSLVS